MISISASDGDMGIDRLNMEKHAGVDFRRILFLSEIRDFSRRLSSLMIVTDFFFFAGGGFLEDLSTLPPLMILRSL